MYTLRAVRWLFYVSVAAVFALAPVNITGTPNAIAGTTNASLVSAANCADCMNKDFYCCGNCEHDTQLDKCTVGEPWCQPQQE